MIKVSVIGVRSWAKVVGLAIALSTPPLAYLALSPLAPPKPPEECKDSLLWVNSDFNGSCEHARHTIEVSISEQRLLVKCLCPKEGKQWK